jgi:hypothetical protein
MTRILIILFIIISSTLKGQVLFVTNESNADAILYETSHKHDADVFIYKVSNRYEARGGYNKKNVVNFYTYVEGIYDKKICFTNQKYKADIIVYYVEYIGESRWVSPSKRNILYYE